MSPARASDDFNGISDFRPAVDEDLLSAASTGRTWSDGRPLLVIITASTLRSIPRSSPDPPFQLSRIRREFFNSTAGFKYRLPWRRYDSRT